MGSFTKFTLLPSKSPKKNNQVDKITYKRIKKEPKEIQNSISSKLKNALNYDKKVDDWTRHTHREAEYGYNLNIQFSNEIYKLFFILISTTVSFCL